MTKASYKQIAKLLREVADLLDLEAQPRSVKPRKFPGITKTELEEAKRLVAENG